MSQRKLCLSVSHPSFHRSHQFDTEEDAEVRFVEHDWKRLKKFFDSWNKVRINHELENC